MAEQNASPVPEKKPTEEVLLPNCPVCKNPIESVRYLDYNEIRVVIHDCENRCTIGATLAPQ